jgi:hypothetical protein
MQAQANGEGQTSELAVSSTAASPCGQKFRLDVAAHRCYLLMVWVANRVGGDVPFNPMASGS